MSSHRVLVALGLVVLLCRVASPAMAEEAAAAPSPVSLKPASSQPSPETSEAERSHRGLRIAGTALYATGVALVAVGTGAFIYGAVSNLETMECDTNCGGVSAHFLRMSLAGAGIGLVLAAAGGVILYSTRGPALVDKPGAEPRPTASKAGALSFALVPVPGAPLASMSLTF